jgi:hypothetical protein
MNGADDDVVLADARALLEAASTYARLTAARGEVEARVLLLARRLTRDWRLTDEEAVREAGARATRLVVDSVRRRGDGR